MNLNDILSETKADEAALGRSPLPDGTYRFKILSKKDDGSTPFKIFISERSNARGNKIAEVGVYMTPTDDSLAKTHGGIYVRLGLAGILEGVSSKTGNEYKINLGENASSVAALLKASGMEPGAVAVADVNTGQPLDLETVEVRTKENRKVAGTPVTLMSNGTGVNESIYQSEFSATVKNTDFGLDIKFNK